MGKKADSHGTNKAMVLKTIILNAPLSRVELSRLTQLSKMSITNYVADLMEDGYLEEVGTMVSESGRKPILLNVVGDRHLIVALQVTRQYISIGLVNLKGVVSRVSMTTVDENETTNSMISKIIMLAEQLITPEFADKIWAIGASSMGPVSNLTGMLNSSAYDFSERNAFDVRSALQERFPYPVFVNNDLNSLVLAEKYFGNAKKLSNVVVVGSSIGLGCGILVNDQLFTGSGGYGAEIGHITVVANGEPCYCGNTGCLEMYASVPKLVEWLQQEGLKQSKERRYQNWLDWLEGVRHGDALCIRALDRLVSYLGAGLVSLVNLFDPEYIFLGEDYCQAADVLAPRLEEYIQKHKFFGKDFLIPIRPSGFMGAAPLVGPAAHAMHMALQKPLPALSKGR